MSQARFQKQQREKARREKAAAKEARREERRIAGESAADDPVEVVDQDAVLADLAALHQRYEAGEVEFEDFLEAKDELTARLDVR